MAISIQQKQRILKRCVTPVLRTAAANIPDWHTKTGPSDDYDDEETWLGSILVIERCIRKALQDTNSTISMPADFHQTTFQKKYNKVRIDIAALF
tara:strand:- start:959 stop:1243 length:285 start_codon:yes stop_codon:yes gene_type:complete